MNIENKTLKNNNSLQNFETKKKCQVGEEENEEKTFDKYHEIYD